MAVLFGNKIEETVEAELLYVGFCVVREVRVCFSVGR